MGSDTPAKAESSRTSAYSGRESTSTRNPHTAVQAKAPNFQELSKLSVEERILAQWRAAFGCPVSDEAKTQFCVAALGRTFNLSDVRLWQVHHQRRPDKDYQEKGKIFLEFFFDGSPDELGGDEAAFKQAFEQMIEAQLQEHRIVEFRKKLTTRRRAKQDGEQEPDESRALSADDAQWREYLRTPIPATELSVRSLREAGCMLRFLVCQTSLSVSASEVLGQIAFQEHFPIDGVAQGPSKSTKPLPRWVYGMAACTAGMTIVTVFAWWQVVRQIALGSPTAALGVE